MGLRYLVLGLALWGAYLIIRHLIRQQKPASPTTHRTRSVDSVECARCGLHLPREEAVKQGEAYYCSLAHAKASKADH